MSRTEEMKRMREVVETLEREEEAKARRDNAQSDT